MAAIFQIRRGDSSNTSSLVNGELYLNTNENSLQVGTSTAGTSIKLVSLNTASFGDIILTGSAFISGNISLGGTITIGDTTSDSVVFNADLSSSIIPDATNTYDLGTSDKTYRKLYVNTITASFISGTIAGLGNVELFSQSVDNRLDQLEIFTGSQESKNVIISAYTSSMNSFTTSVNGHISDINSYTQSLKAAIDVTGGNTRIIGNLIVDGTQTSLNTTETYIEDKSITLASGSLSSAIADGAGLNIAGANVSMSWDNTNSRLYFNTNISALGSISSSTIVGLNNSSVSTYSTSVDSRFVELNNFTSSINSYTQSNDTTNTTQNTRLSRIEESTSSLNSYTSSNDTTNTLQTTRINQLAAGTGSINGVTASLHYFSASATASVIELFTTASDHEERIDYLYSLSGLGGGVNIADKFLAIQYSTASLNAFTASNGNTSLNSYTSSANSRFTRIEESTASLNLFTSSLSTTYEQIASATHTLVSGSSQVSYVGLSNIPAGIVSGSSQLSSVFEQIASATHTLVSGSSQITLSSTTGGGTTANVQFGSLGIGGAASGVSGEIRAWGDITAFYSSDERLKENITPIENAVDKINQMGGYNYDWKEGFETIHSHKGHDLGVIAQEVQSILPEVVTERETGYLAVDYVKLVPVLIEAIKELSAKIDRLESK